MGSNPAMIAAKREKVAAARMVALSETFSYDSHLRSTNELRGYHLQGVDDVIGHVEDFIIDDETWEVLYLVVNTSNWWLGKKVLIPPQWASRISWKERIVNVDMSRETIEGSPEWDPSATPTREYETRLHDYFKRPAYWVDQGQSK